VPLLLLLAATFVQFGIAATRTSVITASLLLAMPATLLWFWTLCTRRESLLRWRGNWLVLGFVLACLISVVAGRAVLPSTYFARSGFERVQIGQLAVLIISPILLILVASVLRTVNQVKIFAAVLPISAVVALPHWLLGLSITPFVNTGGLFSMWTGTLCWSICLMAGRVPLGLRLASLGLFGAVVYRFFFEGLTWFSGWVPLGVAVVTYTLLQSRWLSVPVTICGFWLVATHWQAIVFKYFDLNANRPFIWQQHLGLAVYSPLFGMGPAGQSVFFGSTLEFSSHNNYLDILAQSGILGFTFFMLIFVELFRTFWNALRWTQDEFTRSYLKVGIGGLAGMAVAMMQGDWVIPFAYNQTISGFSYTVYSWLMLGAGLALALRTAPPSARESAEGALAAASSARGKPGGVATPLAHPGRA
jgi:hypothetical protein